MAKRSLLSRCPSYVQYQDVSGSVKDHSGNMYTAFM